MLYVGAGALNYSEAVRELARAGNIPVTTTLQGMGVFDELDPLSLHMLGMHGSAYANHAMQGADVIIAVGARFDDRVTGNLKLFAPAAKRASAEGRGGIIHLEISSKNINKSQQAHHAHTTHRLSSTRAPVSSTDVMTVVGGHSRSCIDCVVCACRAVLCRVQHAYMRAICCDSRSH